MKIDYIVGDKHFKSMEEAEEYEKHIDKINQEKQRFSAERETRAKEVQNAWVKYVKLKKSFEQDYGTTMSLEDFMHYIFD